MGMQHLGVLHSFRSSCRQNVYCFNPCVIYPTFWLVALAFFSCPQAPTFFLLKRGIRMRRFDEASHRFPRSHTQVRVDTDYINAQMHVEYTTGFLCTANTVAGITASMKLRDSLGSLNCDSEAIGRFLFKSSKKAKKGNYRPGKH